MSDSKKLQEFLDCGQYSKNGVERYEWLFGETFLSSGGMAVTAKVLSYVDIKPNSKVLDIGSGLGGHSFVIANNFDVEVIGLDLSENMMEIANRHLQNRPYLHGKVTFRLEDCTQSDFPENSLDLVYSRDSLLHIEDKLGLFTKVYKWLKPGGSLLFTDYIRGEDDTKYSEEFKDYLKKRGYFMSKISEYKKVLQASGFDQVEVENWSLTWENILKFELKRLWTGKELFLSTFSQKDYEELESGWLDKIRRVESGIQGWALGVARKY